MPQLPIAVIALSPREFSLFFPAALRERLTAMLPDAHLIDPLSLREAWGQKLSRIAPEIIVTAWDSAPLPTDLPSLRFVCHVTGSVRHHVDRSLIAQGVLVSNWGSVAAEMVAEAALAMTLAALRRAQYFGDLLHRSRSWVSLPAGTQSLFDRKVGIHGFGQIAHRLLGLLKPFRCEVRAYTEGIPRQAYAGQGIERASSLEALFEWADVIIEVEALTPATRGLVTEALLRRIRPGSSFINVGRGAVVDEAALARVAAEGQVRVALDVYATEPLPVGSPLRGLTNTVTLFPHVGGPTEDRFPECGEHALRNLATYLAGGQPEALVTLDIYDRAT